jgi:hypothetical protein
LSWLDNSLKEQQSIRDLLNMFSEQESRDELGIGQIRDAFSDLLFPGTSTLHTRARYLLIVPWCIRQGERRPDRDQARQIDQAERMVIDALLKAGATDGLIGLRAGIHVKTLPSTIYASALRHYGIDNGAELAQVVSGRAEADELTDRTLGRWPATMPSAPPGFPATLAGGLDLTPGEANWLRERIMTSAPDSLLTHLLRPDHRPDDSSPAPWLDEARDGAPYRVALDLDHARRFSVCMHGAALLYNLLIAERYVGAEHTGIEPPDYRDLLTDWAEEVSLGAAEGWDRADMWSRLIAQNPRISANGLARRFVDKWLDLILEGRAGEAADDSVMRDLVAQREKGVKKAQSRLVNPTLLRTWSGASGNRQLVFRWPQVRGMLTDIHDGAEATDAVAA